MMFITAENPLGSELSKEENNKLTNVLEQLLKEGKYVYRKVIGQYNSKEHNYVISNIALSKIKNIATPFKQESFIFGSINKTKKHDTSNRSCIMQFEYWQIKSNVKHITADAYEKLDDIDRIIYTDKAIDFFYTTEKF